MKRYKSVLKEIQWLKNLAAENGFEEDVCEKTCPFCSEKIKLNAVMCKFCGSHFSKEDIEVETRRKIDVFLASKNIEPIYKGVHVNWDFHKKKTDADYMKTHYRIAGNSLRRD